MVASQSDSRSRLVNLLLRSQGLALKHHFPSSFDYNAFCLFKEWNEQICRLKFRFLPWTLQLIFYWSSCCIPFTDWCLKRQFQLLFKIGSFQATSRFKFRLSFSFHPGFRRSHSKECQTKKGFSICPKILPLFIATITKCFSYLNCYRCSDLVVSFLIFALLIIPDFHCIGSKTLP